MPRETFFPVLPENVFELGGIHASAVLDFLLDRTALWVGGLTESGHRIAASPYWITL